MFGWGWFGRGWGFGRGWWGRGWGRGNPYPFCRAFPWLPRGWWRWGAYPYAWGAYYGYPTAYGWGRAYYPYPWW